MLLLLDPRSCSLNFMSKNLPMWRCDDPWTVCAGRWCFLPAIPLLPLGNWVVPAKPMQELAAAIRRVSRVLWALHVTFQEVYPPPPHLFPFLLGKH